MADSTDQENGHTLKIEANEVIKEIAYAVKSVEVSPQLPCTDDLVYLNLRTLEDKDFTVELSLSGFRVVSNKFNSIDEAADMDSSQYFETIYALLDNVSTGFKNTFVDTLFKRLETLERKPEGEEEEET